MNVNSSVDNSRRVNILPVIAFAVSLQALNFQVG